jgi:hypothetical protein
LGQLSRGGDGEETLISQPVALPVLFGARLPIEIEGYDRDPAPDDLAAAAAAFVAADESALQAVTDDLYAYRRDCAAIWADDPGVPKVERREDAWHGVRFTGHPTVKRNSAGDRGVYVLVPAACDWAPRQGLQLVFKDGRRITRLGPYDGHLSTADATGNPADEGVVYRKG